MRRMGYVAAAAAGMIAPLAIALPAFAATQSPILAGVSGVSSVLQNDWNDDGNGEGNGEGYGADSTNRGASPDRGGTLDGSDGLDDGNGVDQDGGLNNGNNLNDDELRGNNLEERLKVNAAESTATGDVSILVAGTDFPDYEDVVLSSPSLVDNCESTDLEDITAQTDRYGQFNLAVSASQCEVGTYQIIVTEQDDFTSKIVNVNID